MSRHITGVLALLLIAPLDAQALPDIRVLLPDGYQLFVRADAARIQQSEFWRVFSHTALIKAFLEKQLPEHMGFEVDDLKKVQVGIVDGPGPEFISLYLEGTKELRPETVVEVTCRLHNKAVEPTTVAGRKAWVLPDESHGPSVVDFGPGMLWMASPGRFVRERLEQIQKSSPHKPSQVMKALVAHEAGEFFLATDMRQPLAMINEAFAAKAETSATGIWIRVDFQPDLILRAGLSIEDQSKGAKAKDTLDQLLLDLGARLKKNNRAAAAEMLKKIALKTERDEITTEIKIDKKDIASVAQSALMLIGGTWTTEAGPAATAEEDVFIPEATPTAPQSKPAEKK